MGITTIEKGAYDGQTSMRMDSIDVQTDGQPDKQTNIHATERQWANFNKVFRHNILSPFLKTQRDIKGSEVRPHSQSSLSGKMNEMARGSLQGVVNAFRKCVR